MSTSENIYQGYVTLYDDSHPLFAFIKHLPEDADSIFSNISTYRKTDMNALAKVMCSQRDDP